MKVKMNILLIAIVLALIVFTISVVLQKKLVHNEAMVSCLVMKTDINENELATEKHFRLANIPISLVALQKIVTNVSEVEGLYAKDNIKTGQIVMKSQFDTKENIAIYDIEEGKEKVAIKIKAAENGMAYQIKEKSKVNVYVTLRSEYANQLAPEKERLMVGEEYDGYTVIKLLENIEVLGRFTMDGVEMNHATGENLDSILIGVSSEEAKQINLIRDLAIFNITGVSSQTTQETQPIVTEVTISSFSGDKKEPAISISGECK